MGRHSRQTSAGHVRSTALRTVAALGVAGTIAVAFHASSGDDRTARARADVTAQDRGPDLPASPAASPGEPGSRETGGPSPSSSAAPGPVTHGSDTGSLRSGAAAAESTPDGRPGRAREHAAAARKAEGAGRKPGGGPAPGGSASGAGSAPSSAGTNTGTEPRAAGPAGGTGGSTGGGSRDDDGTALSGTVEGLTGALGDLTGNLTGGLGWGGNGLPTG
ncbi:hypothetical protein [Streptomyces xinghaiensis]|uniref:hypothetical protein n=1 Tax=Streptomyces xinghaiensis TaxID=1038928 RepID=UPI002E0D3853|nr:hypothetical protein OG463_13980 [Streptomyces xinghaiensis]